MEYRPDNTLHVMLWNLEYCIYWVLLNAVMKTKSEQRRPFIGEQLHDCWDASGLFYILPFQKGYLVNWDVQKTVWDYIFSKEVFNMNHSNTTLVITEPYFNFTSVHEAMSEIFFEEYEVDTLLRIDADDLSVHKYHHERPKELCCLHVDSGFSFTHIAPYVQGKKRKEAIIRIDMESNSLPTTSRGSSLTGKCSYSPAEDDISSCSTNLAGAINIFEKIGQINTY